jgi:predicted alpha/beta-hydrolase family hydrolase
MKALKLMKLLSSSVTIVMCIALSNFSHADTLIATNAKGMKLDVIADFPAGKGPFPGLVIASGQGYHMALPALEQTARQLVVSGVAVYRFNWAYFTKVPKGESSEDLSAEVDDMQAVIALARKEPRVDKSKLSVGGKSLGSLVAWRVLAKDKSLLSGLLLTPVCSQVDETSKKVAGEGEENYPGLLSEKRPLALILGNQDPICNTSVLYAFIAKASGPVNVNVVGGNHSFGNNSLKGSAAVEAKARNVNAVAQLAVNFLAQVHEQ